MRNREIREKAKSKCVRFWEIADVLGVSISTFSIKLRHELPEEEKSKILDIIDSIAEGRN